MDGPAQRWMVVRPASPSVPAHSARVTVPGTSGAAPWTAGCVPGPCGDPRRAHTRLSREHLQVTTLFPHLHLDVLSSLGSWQSDGVGTVFSRPDSFLLALGAANVPGDVVTEPWTAHERRVDFTRDALWLLQCVIRYAVWPTLRNGSESGVETSLQHRKRDECRAVAKTCCDVYEIHS